MRPGSGSGTSGCSMEVSSAHSTRSCSCADCARWTCGSPPRAGRLICSRSGSRRPPPLLQGFFPGVARPPALRQVLYPGLLGHPGHSIAARQMTGGFGGMLSIRLGSRASAIAVAANVQLWRRATSFGGTESLIEHRASIEGEGSPCPDDLLRLSVGLEDPEDLHRDLTQALNVLT